MDVGISSGWSHKLALYIFIDEPLQMPTHVPYLTGQPSNSQYVSFLSVVVLSCIIMVIIVSFRCHKNSLAIELQDLRIGDVRGSCAIDLQPPNCEVLKEENY